MADANVLERLETLRAIRHALHIGLESFGEIERVQDVWSLFESTTKDLPESLKPIHPTGANDTIGVFAGALRLLDSLDPTTA